MTAEEQKAFNNGFVIGKTSKGIVAGTVPPPQTFDTAVAIPVSYGNMWYVKNLNTNDVCRARIPADNSVIGNNGTTRVHVNTNAKVIKFKGKLYLMAYGGIIIESINGTDWTYTGTCPTKNLYTLLVCGDRVLAYGGGTTNDIPCYTFDFITWTSTNKIPYYESIWVGSGAYNAGVAVISGGSGLIYYTNDFINWIRITNSYSWWTGELVLYGDRFVVPMTYSSYNAVLATSTNGINWSFVMIGFKTISKMIHFEGNYFIIGTDMSNNAGVFMSANLTSWVRISSINSFNNFAILKGNLYAWASITIYVLDKTTFTFNEIYKYPNNVGMDNIFDPEL